jgi:hypothetical protein
MRTRRGIFRASGPSSARSFEPLVSDAAKCVRKGRPWFQEAIRERLQ